MKTGNNGIELIKTFEGCRLKGYLCPAGVPTIGYGHSGILEGKPVAVGMKITTDRAVEILKTDLVRFEKAVDSLVTVELTQNQFDALVSFVYNIGVGSFKLSTLLRKLNASDYAGAAGEFLKWNKAGGKVLSGLTRRRKAEQALFLAK